MHQEIRRQRTYRALQSVVLVGALVFLSARAIAVLFGPVAGWVTALTAIVGVSLRLRRAQVHLPPNAYHAGPRRFPELHDALVVLARRAGLPSTPGLYFLDRPEVTAFATGVGDEAKIVVSRGLLSVLSIREIIGVLAHEIAHIRNHDLYLFTIVETVRRLTRGVAVVLALLIVVAFPLVVFGSVTLPTNAFLYVSIIPLVSLVAQFALLRTREFQADIGAVELTGDPRALAAALGRLDAYGPGFLTSGAQDPIVQLFRTHPSTSERIARLLEIERKNNRRTLDFGVKPM